MTEMNLMEYLTERHKAFCNRIAKGQGKWGDPDYTSESEWAALIARRSEVTMILYKLQQQSKAGLTSG